MQALGSYTVVRISCFVLTLANTFSSSALGFSSFLLALVFGRSWVDDMHAGVTLQPAPEGEGGRSNGGAEVVSWQVFLSII